MTENMFGTLCLTVVVCVIIICDYLETRSKKDNNDNE